MAKIQLSKIPLSAVVELLDFVRGMFGKKVRIKKAQQVLGDDADFYLSGCEKLQVAADLGFGLGPLTPDEVRVIARADNAMVKLATKIQRAMDS